MSELSFRERQPFRFPVLLAIAAMLGMVVAETGTCAASSEVDRLIMKIGSEKWEQRCQAFYDLLSLGNGDGKPSAKGDVKVRLSSLMKSQPEEKPAITRALIKTLEVENSYVGGNSDLSEDFTEYYGDLITAVSSMKEPRSAEALSGALGSGNLVVQALVELGEASVAPVLGRLQSSNSKTVSFSCCMVLRLMLRGSAPSPITNPKLVGDIKSTLARKPCKQ